MQLEISEMTDMMFKFYPQVRKACRNLVSIKDLPISMTQLSCLYTIEQSGEITMSCLADSLRMSNQQLTKVVDNLAGFEMVSRKTDESNRRRIKVCVSNKGAKTLANLRLEVVRKLSVILGKLPEEEVTKLCESFSYINSCFESFKKIVDKH